MAKEDYKLYTFKLHKDEDRDLIEFLNNVPKTHYIKTALRYYKTMNPPAVDWQSPTFTLVKSHENEIKEINEQKEKASAELLGDEW